MARIVLTTLGSAGDLNPFLALGLALRGRGHAVSFAVEDAFRPPLAAAGFPIHRLSGDSVAMLAPHADALFGGATPVASLRILLDHYLIPTLPDKIAELRAACAGADLLVAAAAQLAAGTVADLTGIRWATVALTPVTLPSAYVESQPAPFPPALQRASNRLTWALGSQVLRRMADAPVNRVRAGLGLPPRRDVFWLGNASSQLTCLACSPAFQPPAPDWPPYIHVTGFCFWDTPADWAPTPELAAFLERPGPLVAVTAGSIAPSVAASFAPFYRASIAAIRRLGARALLVGVRPDDLATGADASGRSDALALPFAPYSRIFPRCAAVIHHGGIGTAAQCLRYGVPSLVVPWGVDQFYTGGRLARLRAGLTLTRRRYTSDRAASALARLLHDPAFRTAVRAIRDQITREDGVEALCDALEIQLRTPATAPAR